MPATVNIGTLEGLIRWKADSAEVDKSLAEMAKKADVSKTTLNQYNKELAGADAAYKKVVASIDPAAAATQKFEKAQSALSKALHLGLIDHEKHNELLEKAKEHYSSSHAPLESLVGKILQLTGALGPAGAAGHEVAEGLESIISKGSGLGEVVASLGPLLPVIAGLAAALIGVGLGFEAIKLAGEFIGEAVSEGLKLQQVIEKLNNSLRNTGSYSGLTSHEIVELADSYEMLTGRTKEEILQSAIILTRFQHLTEDSYPKALNATLAYAKAMGYTADEAARKLGPALDGNSKSVAGLKDAGIVLTKGQKETLNQLVETGQIVKYQAYLFDILKEKVGEVSDKFDLNLIKQAKRAHNVLDEFKEGIASEIIPALEDLVGEVVDSLGGWKALQLGVTEIGHDIGDAIRKMIYGAMDLYLQWDEATHKISATLKSVFAEIIEGASKVTKAIGIITADPVKVAASKELLSLADDLRESAVDDAMAVAADIIQRDKLNRKLLEHRQALEGNDNKYKQHGTAQDEVASKQKKLNDLTIDAEKVTHSHSDKLADLTNKLIDEGVAQGVLLSAAEKGLDVYARVLLQEERKKVVLAATTQIEKEHRSEIEKLQSLEEKARDNNQPAQAEKFREQVEKSNASLPKQIELVGSLAGKNFDLKHATDAVLESNKNNYDFTTQQITLQAQLTDELTGTTIASRENSIQIEIQKRVLDSLKHTHEDLTDTIAETVRREHEFTDSMKDALDVARELGNLNNKTELQTAISRIDTDQSRYLQQIEQQYLETIASIGHGSIVEGQKIIDAVQQIFDSLGVDIGNISDKIKDDLKKLQDAEITNKISGASKTPYDLYREERDRIEEYISSSTDRTTEQVKDAQAYLEHLDENYWSNQLSSWSSALNNLGGLFGGFLEKIASGLSKAIADVQSAYQTGQQLGGLLNNAGIGGAGLGSAMGGILAEFQIFYTVYSIVSKMIANERAHKFGTATELQVIAGEWSSASYFNEAGKKISEAIRQMLTDVANSIGGVLLDLPQIAIRARHDGKKFAAYVAGIFVGEFNSAQEAMQAAVASAITQANFAGVSQEIIQALHASIGATLDQIEANIDTAKLVRGARLGDAGEQYVERIDKYNQEIEAARRLGLATDDLIRARDKEAEAAKNQALGIDTSAADRLASIRSLSAGIAEASSSIEASLQQQIDAAQRQLERLLARPGSLGGGAGSGLGGNGTGPFSPGQTIPGDPEFSSHLPTKEGEETNWDRQVAHLRQSIDEWTHQLDRVPKALSDQEINMGIFDTLYQYLQSSPKYAKEAAKWAKIKVDIEFDQIKLQLELLGKWEEFQGMFNDAYNAARDAAGHQSHGGGGKGGDRQSVQSFIDDRRFQLSLAEMDQFHQQLAQIKKDYDAQLLAAGKDAKLRAQLLALQQQETANVTKAHQKDIADRFIQLVSPDDVFEQTTKQYEDMKKEVADAGYGADRTATMLHRLTAVEIHAIEKLSMGQFSSLIGDLSNIIADSSTNAKQHLLHNELLRAQEIINYQIKMIELRDEYVILRAKGKLTQDEIALLEKAFGWIDANANILPGGKDWVPSFDQVTSAASDLSSAAVNQNDAADKLKTAVQSLIDYQTTLHTDSSLGLVDPRTALNNSKADYESDRLKALTGDVDAIAKLKDYAETYRKNLIAFSPSSELTASVLGGIDQTINQIRSLPSVKAALSSDGQAIVSGLGHVASGVVALQSIMSAVNDNVSNAATATTAATTQAADKLSDYSSQMLEAQKKSADSLNLLQIGVNKLAANVLVWRAETRANRDETEEHLTDAVKELEKIASNTRHDKPIAGTGG